MVSGWLALLGLGKAHLVLQLGTKEGGYSIIEPQFPHLLCMGLCCGTRPEHVVEGRRIFGWSLGFRLGLSVSSQALSGGAP